MIPIESPGKGARRVHQEGEEGGDGRRSRKEKLEEQEQDEEDDYMYWDSISNHLPGEQKLAKKKVPVSDPNYNWLIIVHGE